MFGNIVNNTQIVSLKESGHIEIDPFDEKRLKLAHYPLRASGLLKPGHIGNNLKHQRTTVHNFDSQEPYVFKENEYLLLEIEEHIVVKDGIVGHFVPSSFLIFQGFSLVCGKIDPHYGEIKGKRQKITFGIKNEKNENNSLTGEDVIAHIYFIDMRGLDNQLVKYTKREMAEFLSRYPRFLRAQDDGPTYPAPDPD